MQVVRLNVNPEGEGGFVFKAQTGFQFNLLGVAEECGGEKKLIFIMVQFRVET